jgi:hypothetical protein
MAKKTRLVNLSVDRAARKALSDLEWAIDCLEESATPQVVDVERLIADVRGALEALRKARGL